MWKIWKSMKWETFSFKAVINELDFFKEQLIFNETSKEKRPTIVCY